MHPLKAEADGVSLPYDSLEHRSPVPPDQPVDAIVKRTPRRGIGRPQTAPGHPSKEHM